MKKGEETTYKILDCENNEVDKVTFRVHGFGGLGYGNHTVTSVKFEKADYDGTFDTRYYTGTLKDFVEWYEKNKLSAGHHFA